MRGERNIICTLPDAICGVLGHSEIFDRCKITSPFQPIISMIIVSITATFRGTSTAEHQLPFTVYDYNIQNDDLFDVYTFSFSPFL